MKQGTAQKAGCGPARRDVLALVRVGREPSDKDASPRHVRGGAAQEPRRDRAPEDDRPGAGSPGDEPHEQARTDARGGGFVSAGAKIQVLRGRGRRTHDRWTRRPADVVATRATCPICPRRIPTSRWIVAPTASSRAGVRVARIGRPEAVRQVLVVMVESIVVVVVLVSSWSKDRSTNARQRRVASAPGGDLRDVRGRGSDILERFSSRRA